MEEQTHDGNTMTPTILECAFIIDDILSTGRRMSNDEIYEELNNIFNIVDVISPPKITIAIGL